MAVNKAFVVKNGLEVADNLLFANNNKVGIGTTIPDYTLDVRGSIALRQGLFIPPEQQPQATTGTVNAATPFLITGVNTSFFKVNDLIDDGPGGLLTADTKVVNIGISSIGIFPNHTRIFGESQINIFIIRNVTSGEDNQVLISRGPNLSPVWRTPTGDTNIEEFSQDSIVFPVFVSGAGSTTANINSTGLSYNPGLNYFGIGTTDLDVALTVSGDASISGIITADSISAINSIDSFDVLTNFLDVSQDLQVAGISTFGLDGSITIDPAQKTITVGSGVTITENDIFIGEAIVLGNSGIITALQFVGDLFGTAAIAQNVSIVSLASTEKYYPTFVSGIGETSLGISTDKIHFIPNSGFIGIGTDQARFNFDLIGDLGVEGRFYAATAPEIYSTRLATISGTDRLFVGIDTSQISVGDLINESEDAGVNFIPANTLITSIGIGSVGISNQHTYLSFIPTSFNVDLFNINYITPGKTNDILVSQGSTGPVIWKKATDIVRVGITTTDENTNFNIVFTLDESQTGGADLKINETNLVFNPLTSSLGIGTTSPRANLDVEGNVIVSGIITAEQFVGTATTAETLLGIANTSINVIGGIASVTQLDVSGESILNDVTAGIVTATEFFGSGVNLAGIVTQITPGIGIDLTPTNGKGSVEIQAYRPTGKTIFVNQNGNDNNTGLSENHAKRTIKAAASAAIFGDTIKVYPGVYVEDNPIILKKTVSVEGTELRNCVVTARYPYLDLFHVNNGCHITDMSFIGPDMIDGAAVVALQPLDGVAVDRFFDAARMIRLNLDYIANETIGFLTSTSYKSPEFTIVNSAGIATDPVNCKDDIKDIWKSIIYDITRGGNSKCVDAGKLYYDDSGNLVHITGVDLNGYSVKDATIDAIDYSFNVARAIINNVTWGGSPVGLGTTVTNAVYDEVTGVTEITALDHGLIKDDAVKIVGLAFTCPSGPGIVTYPSGAFGYIFNVLSVSDENTFEVIVGQSTLPHTYVSGGTVQKYENFQHDTYQVKDLGMQKDPLTGFNNGINGCANVVSALRSCVGIITNIVGFGSEAFGSIGIKTSYPGNAGTGFTSTVAITSALYDQVSGRTVIEASGIDIKQGELIEIRDLEFSCSSNGPESIQKFPSGAFGYQFYIDKINTDGTFEVYVGPSTLPHTYVGGGVVVDRSVPVTDAIYDNNTGITTITAIGASIETNDLITLRGLEFSCPSGSGTTTIYPTGNEGFDFRVLDIIVDKPFGITSAIYDNNTGLTTITSPNFIVGKDSIVELRDLEFSCPSGAGTTTIYPTGNNGYRFRVLDISGDDFVVNVGPSTIPHDYVSGGFAIDRTLTANDTFTIQVGPSTIPHTYVSGGIVIPPYSVGVGPITQGPYVRNCTNFIPKSIGMKIDGFAAEPGDKDDIGVTGTMSVDSYTQYNQGGIGVSITNGAYAQLVSIFTICDDIAIFTGSGGQCDITNSNSSFGRLGLYSDGVGDPNSKSIYRSTGVALSTVPEKTNIVQISGVGDYRPYDGQVCYFGELFFFVSTIEIVDGGSGYTVAPRVTITPPEGPNGITAQASSVVENGRVVAINVVNSGTQYKKPPTITIDPPGSGSTATAKAGRMQPIYYKVDSATLPSAGVSTVSLLQNLNNTVSAGTTVYFSRVSLQITSSHSFEWVGSGNDINSARPALGGVVIPENEVVQENGGLVVYTSTDQAGNFKIGDGVIINQATGQISGRDFTKALFTTMTPFILALSE
jgi:hypothetical protein